MKRVHRVLIALLSIMPLLLAKSSLGCVKVQSHVKVAKDLVVFIHDPDGKPLRGVEVRAYVFISKPPHSELVASAISKENGKAEINLGDDNYSLVATVSGVRSETVLIDVYDDGSGAPEISLTWPGGPVTAIQNVAGVLGEGRSRVPWVGARVTL